MASRSRSSPRHTFSLGSSRKLAHFPSPGSTAPGIIHALQAPKQIRWASVSMPRSTSSALTQSPSTKSTTSSISGNGSSTWCPEALSPQQDSKPSPSAEFASSAKAPSDGMRSSQQFDVLRSTRSELTTTRAGGRRPTTDDSRSRRSEASTSITAQRSEIIPCQWYWRRS